MSSLIEREEKERVTSVDLRLMQRFARRILMRMARMGSAVRNLWGPKSTTYSNQHELNRIPLPFVVGGLEVYSLAASGWTVSIRRGVAMVEDPAAADVTRPGSWSGKDDSDDDGSIAAELPVVVTGLAPSSVPGGALASHEWWLVYVTPTETVIESDSNRKVYNQITGAFDAASTDKVKEVRLVPTVLRGTGGGTPPATPAGTVPLAWLYVPSGATNLSQAFVYDLRVFSTDKRPNEVWGRWECPLAGQLANQLDTSGVFHGAVFARIRGELLSVRARTSLRVQYLAEPGASWPSAAVNSPKIAYLYLCKVRGLVPRPVGYGASSAVPNGSDANMGAVMMEGALVLSPTAPKSGCASSDTNTGHRWDLRPTATLTLPGSHPLASGPSYEYSGITVPADDAICIGFMRYTDTDGGYPMIFGSMFCDEGWHTGEGIRWADGTYNFTADAMCTTAVTLDNASTPRTATHTFTLAALGSWVFPIDAIRGRYEAVVPGSDDIILTRQHTGTYVNTGSDATLRYLTLDSTASCPGRSPATVIGTLGGGTFSSANVRIIGVRFPYRVPLVTLFARRAERADRKPDLPNWLAGLVGAGAHAAHPRPIAGGAASLPALESTELVFLRSWAIGVVLARTAELRLLGCRLPADPAAARPTTSRPARSARPRPPRAPSRPAVARPPPPAVLAALLRPLARPRTYACLRAPRGAHRGAPARAGLPARAARAARARLPAVEARERPKAAPAGGAAPSVGVVGAAGEEDEGEREDGEAVHTPKLRPVGGRAREDRAFRPGHVAKM